MSLSQKRAYRIRNQHCIGVMIFALATDSMILNQMKKENQALSLKSDSAENSAQVLISG